MSVADTGHDIRIDQPVFLGVVPWNGPLDHKDDPVDARNVGAELRENVYVAVVFHLQAYRMHSEAVHMPAAASIHQN